MKKIFYDLETTGLDPDVNGVHQISGCVEIDGTIKEWFNYKVKPFPTDKIDLVALEMGGVTEEIILEYPSPEEVHKALLEMLAKYVNKFNKKDKFFLYGFNNRRFDDGFIRSWFNKLGDKYMGSWFWPYTSDVMVIAVDCLIEDIPQMENFKLKTVAKWLGIEIDETKLHDALYDIEITVKIYQHLKCTKI